MYLNNNFNKLKFFRFLYQKGIKILSFIFCRCLWTIQQSCTRKLKTKPLSPYGQSKLKFEKIFKKTKNNINYVILRYFNVVGAEKKLRCGFETKRIKGYLTVYVNLILEIQTFIFGKDFKTNDGTAIRDFIYSDFQKFIINFQK